MIFLQKKGKIYEARVYLKTTKFHIKLNIFSQGNKFINSLSYINLNF